MSNERYSNVWDALEDSPEEALNMRLRSQLMMTLAKRVASWGVSQKEGAKRLGITQPRLSSLLNGNISAFSLDALVNLTAAANLTVKVDVQDAPAPIMA